jgi:hypothetical protein
MKLLLANFLTTSFSFYAHNGPVVFSSLGSLIAIAQLLRSPSRKGVFALLGFLLLIFSFEYQKHFTNHFNSHLVLQLADPDLQSAEFSLLSRFFNQILPLALDFSGWGMLFLSLFFTSQNPAKYQN